MAVSRPPLTVLTSPWACHQRRHWFFWHTLLMNKINWGIYTERANSETKHFFLLICFFFFSINQSRINLFSQNRRVFVVNVCFSFCFCFSNNCMVCKHLSKGPLLPSCVSQEKINSMSLHRKRKLFWPRQQLLLLQTIHGRWK